MPHSKQHLIPKTVPISTLLNDVQPIEWLIGSVFTRGTLAALVAPPSRFKSFIAVDMACSIATGTDFMGYPTSAGPVVYLCGEGKRGLLDRVAAWFHTKGLDHNDAPLMITEGTFALQESDMVSAYLSKVTAELKAAPQITKSPSLIIVDTYSRYAAGLDENSASETALMIKQLERLQDTFGCAVLLIHHVSKSTGQARGSSAFGGALDWEYTICRQGDGEKHTTLLDHKDLRGTLSCTKPKDNCPPPDINFLGSSVDGIHDGIKQVRYNSLVFGLDDGSAESIYKGLGTQAQLVLEHYLLCSMENPKVTLRILEEASGKSDVCRPLKLINAWLVGRLNLRDITMDRPTTDGLSALKDLLAPFKQRGLPEAQPRGAASLQTLITDTEI